MVTPDYYHKKIELLLAWAVAVTNPALQIELIERAFDILPCANCTDDQTLRLFQHTMESIMRSNERGPGSSSK
jgi:hypothetical protein